MGRLPRPVQECGRGTVVGTAAWPEPGLPVWLKITNLQHFQTALSAEAALKARSTTETPHYSYWYKLQTTVCAICDKHWKRKHCS